MLWKHCGGGPYLCFDKAYIWDGEDEKYEDSAVGLGCRGANANTRRPLPLQNTNLQTSGITVTKDRERIETFTFAHPHPMAQSIGYFNLTKMLFVLLMLLNAFVEVREGSEFDMRETDAAFPAVP